MRKNLLNNMAWLSALVLICAAQPAAAGTPAFLIYNDGVDAGSEGTRLELNGVRVKQHVPPSILVVDLPDSIRPNKISGTKAVYTSAISLTALEPYGPVAVAAGMQWNRNALRSSHASGQGFGAMRTLVSQKSLPGPERPTLATSGSTGMRAEWPAIEGALYYELEAALDSSFSQRFIVTRNNLPVAEFALPEGTGAKTVHVRVRGIDMVDTEDGNKEEVIGAWSRVASLGVTATPSDATLPTLIQTSPNPNYSSEGFTLILEWMAGSTPARLQVARDSNFESTLYDTVISGGEFVIPSPGLRIGDTLHWRVRSWGVQKSPWSESRSIRIGSPRNEHIDMFVNPEAPQ